MANYDDATKYGKKLTLETGEEPTVLEGAAACEMQLKLENDPRYTALYDSSSKKTTYYDTASAACGMCKVATLESTHTAGEKIPCEDPIPSCPEVEYEQVSPKNDGKENPARDGWFEKVEKPAEHYVATSDTVVDADKTYYKVKVGGE